MKTKRCCTSSLHYLHASFQRLSCRNRNVTMWMQHAKDKWHFDSWKPEAGCYRPEMCGLEFFAGTWASPVITCDQMQVCVVFKKVRAAWVPSGYSGFLPRSKEKQVRLIVDSKLPVGVNVSVMFVCLYMSAPWWIGNLSRMNPALAQCQLGLTPALHVPEKGSWMRINEKLEEKHTLHLNSTYIARSSSLLA